MDIFDRAGLENHEDPTETNDIFDKISTHKQEQIIPPIGIAKPELVESFFQNIENEDQILKDIAEAEAYERESGLETGTREVLGHGARALEGFFGGINTFLNAITPELSENEEGMPYGPGEAPQGLPGPHELREFTKEKTGKYLEPKSELSKATQEISSDIGSMFSTPGLAAWQKILQPIGGQIIKQVIKASGGGESAQEWGKFGFMGLSTIAQLGNAPKVASRALAQVEQMLPQGLRFSTKPTEQALMKIKNTPWYKTGRTPSKGSAFDEIERIEKAIQNGTIDAHEAMQLRRDINEARKELGAFKLNQVADTKAARRYLDEVDNALMESFENYGKNINPEWLKSYKLANEAFRVTQRSRQISDFISKHAKPLQSETAKTLFHVAGTSGALNVPLIATAAAPTLAAAKTIQIMNRMIRSPVLRNHYIEVLSQAAIGNAAATQKALEKFDKAAQRADKKNSQ